MNMKKRVIILAIIFSIITSALIYLYLNSVDVPAVSVAVNKTEVVVAANTIPENVIITGEMLTVMSLPTDGVHGDAARTVEEVVGFLSKNEIIAGEQVLKSRVATDLTSSSLAYRIPEGMRAMTLSSNEISGVAGFIAVGDKVDILVSYTDMEALGQGLQIITQFQNVEVVAKGPAVSGATGGQSDTGVSSSLTLLVTPDDAQKLVYATASGSINMTLRNPVDMKILELSGYGMDAFEGLEEEVE